MPLPRSRSAFSLGELISPVGVFAMAGMLVLVPIPSAWEFIGTSPPLAARDMDQEATHREAGVSGATDSSGGSNEATTNPPKPINWRGTDMDGQPCQIPPRGDEGSEPIRGLALIFVMHDCPVANSYAPEIRRIHDDFVTKGIRFYLVHVDPDLKPESARHHAREYSLPGRIVLDPHHELVAASGVTRVPEAAVFSPRGHLLYRGRIDDLYAGFGKRRTTPIELDLRNALDAVVAGKPVPPSTGEVVGCPVPLKNRN